MNNCKRKVGSCPYRFKINTKHPKYSNLVLDDESKDYINEEKWLVVCDPDYDSEMESECYDCVDLDRRGKKGKYIHKECDHYKKRQKQEKIEAIEKI